MANRIERLIGYQLVNKTALCNDVIFNASKIFQFIDPVGDVPLTFSYGTEENTLVRDATVEDVKTLVGINKQIIDVESTRVHEFLTRFLDTTSILNGLVNFGETRTNVEDDKTSVRQFAINIAGNLPGLKNRTQLTNFGIILGQYAPKVTGNMSHHVLDADAIVNSFQDVLNAMAFELQGINSYTGMLDYTSPAQIRSIVEARIGTAYNLWGKIVVDDENIGFKGILDNVNRDIETASSLNELANLGIYINSNVPQLPLLRRWWQYNG